MSLRRIMLLALLPAVFVVGAHVVLQIFNDWLVLDGRLIGPDAYMRLLRVMELAQTGVWYDPVSERGNAPFGEVLHWTRPLDVILLLGAGLGAVITDFQTALFVWSALFGPSLHILTLVVLLWACAPLFKLVDRAGLLLLGLLFAVQFFITFQFAVGRPDHHGLNLLLFIWQMGFALHLTRPDCAGNFAALAALPATFALWVSIEGGLGTAMILTALTTAWIIHGGAYLARLARFLTFLCLGLAMALALERPPGDLLAIEFDRLSIVHLAVFVLLAMIVQAARLFAGQNISTLHRLALTSGGGIATVAVMALWVPDIIHGPMANMAPLVRDVWFLNNAEVSPLLQFEDLRRTGPKALAHLGLLLFAVPALLHLVRKGGDRLNWSLLAAFLGLAAMLAMGEARWVGYGQILALPPCIALLQSLFRLFAGTGLLRTALRVGSVIIMATGPLIGSGMLRQALPVEKTGKPCDLPGISHFLAQKFANRPHILLNFIYSGPELLFRTHHSVVATPYHRNTDGIVDTIHFLAAVDDDQAKKIAKKRQVDLVLICAEDPEASNYRAKDGSETLLMRLEAGQVPAWLQSIPLPPDLRDKFMLFQVIPANF